MEEMNSKQKVHTNGLYMRQAFETDAQMTAYYLLLNHIFNPKMDVLECSQQEALEALQRKLAQVDSYLTRLDTYAFGQSVEDLNKMCGTYLVWNTSNPAERLRMSGSVGKHLAFVTEMAANRPYVKQLKSIFHCHLDNVRYLLEKSYPG